MYISYNTLLLTQSAWNELELKYPELNGFTGKHELQGWLADFGRISRSFMIGRKNPERAFEVGNVILLDPFDKENDAFLPLLGHQENDCQ
jgi:hypothetical protein